MTIEGKYIVFTGKMENGGRTQMKAKAKELGITILDEKAYAAIAEE